MTKTFMPNVLETVQKMQRLRSRTLGSRGLSLRLDGLNQIRRLLVDHEDRWLLALKEDLDKPLLEAYATEIAFLLNELEDTIKHLAKWMKPVVKHRLLISGAEKTSVTAEPFGSVLILSPWNYPLQLALGPVIGAIAAGNGAVLKPSESAPAVSRLLAELVPQYLDPDLLYVVEGDADVAKTLTDMEWDFVFFTGSPQIGAKVYQAAAKHLTPVVLELGGKNPCIIDETTMNEETIKHIIWSKFLNVGQTCIAPDTIFVPRLFYQQFLEQAKQQIVDFYGDTPIKSPDYGRIVHKQHLANLTRFLKDGQVYYGGEIDEATRFMAPTLMTDVKEGSALAEEEIFGPILPIIPYDSIDDVIKQYQTRPVPLVIYLFTKNKKMVQYVQERLESGALSINQLMVHVTSPNTPFGGKGQSGLGNYHGEASFKTFTYQRTLYQKKMPFSLPQQFPPYSKVALSALKRFRRIVF
ncbi:aldehyde dehydrogenase family protein [Fundicoccus sp. Sow4_D5]|uniref:aldehyde dehydrogenase family protein n=1 Tax=Fundicoccus sp. Sow4_D5 TaxID=3438782 RepID=UPI003F92A328